MRAEEEMEGKEGGGVKKRRVGPGGGMEMEGCELVRREERRGGGGGMAVVFWPESLDASAKSFYE